MTTYRYTIELDRYAEEDYGPEATADHGDDKNTHHDGSDEAAIAQVARELQGAMDKIGEPVGTFRIVRREILPRIGHPFVALVPGAERGPWADQCNYGYPDNRCDYPPETHR